VLDRLERFQLDSHVKNTQLPAGSIQVAKRPARLTMSAPRSLAAWSLPASEKPDHRRRVVIAFRDAVLRPRRVLDQHAYIRLKSSGKPRLPDKRSGSEMSLGSVGRSDRRALRTDVEQDPHHRKPMRRCSSYRSRRLDTVRTFYRRCSQRGSRVAAHYLLSST
jgi:hypothetical protein